MISRVNNIWLLNSLVLLVADESIPSNDTGVLNICSIAGKQKSADSFRRPRQRNEKYSGRSQVNSRQCGFKGTEELSLLLDNRVRRCQLLFQSESRMRLTYPQDALAVPQFDELELEILKLPDVNHGGN